MKSLKIYIYNDEYNLYSDMIDDYIKSHKTSTKNGTKYTCLTLTIANLCDLWYKIGKNLRIRSPFVGRKKIIDNLTLSGLIINTLVLEDSAQLVQTICDIYKDELLNMYDKNPYVLTILFRSKDINAWKYAPIKCKSRKLCITVLQDIFLQTSDDLYIEAMAKYLRKLDKFLVKDNSDLDVYDKRAISSCVISSIENNNQKMILLLLKSNIRNYMIVTMSHFMFAVFPEQFDVADKLLELVLDKNFDQDVLCRNHEVERYSIPCIYYNKISLTSVMYLFDLISSDRIDLCPKDVYAVIVKCCELRSYMLFIFMITYYPINVTRDLLEEIEKFPDSELYIDELMKTIILNNKLMKKIAE